jgi:hypothetical protein
VRSRIGPARRALWELLVASPDLHASQRCFGWPDVHKPLMVVLLGITDGADLVAGLGPLAPSDEAFGIELVVKHHDAGASLLQAPDVDLAAFATADAIRDIVRANPYLKGTVRVARIASQRSEGTGRPLQTEQNTQATGLLCAISMTVACIARAR